MSESSISSGALISAASSGPLGGRYAYQKGTELEVIYSYTDDREENTICIGELIYFLKNDVTHPGWFLINREGYIHGQTAKTNRFWVPENYVKPTGKVKSSQRRTSLDTSTFHPELVQRSRESTPNRLETIEQRSTPIQVESSKPQPRARRKTMNSTNSFEPAGDTGVEKLAEQIDNYEFLDTQFKVPQNHTGHSTPTPVPRTRRSIKGGEMKIEGDSDLYLSGCYASPVKTVQRHDVEAVSNLTRPNTVVERVAGLERPTTVLDRNGTVKERGKPPPLPDISLKPKHPGNISLSNQNTPINCSGYGPEYSLDQHDLRVPDLSRSVSIDSLDDVPEEPPSAPAYCQMQLSKFSQNLTESLNTHTGHSIKDQKSRHTFHGAQPPALSVNTDTDLSTSKTVNRRPSPKLPAAQAAAAYNHLSKEGFLKWRSVRHKNGTIAKKARWNSHFVQLCLRQNPYGKIQYQLIFYPDRKAREKDKAKTCFILRECTVSWVTSDNPDADFKSRKSHVFVISRQYDSAKIALAFENQNVSEDWHKLISHVTRPIGESSQAIMAAAAQQAADKIKSRTLDIENPATATKGTSRETLPRNLKISPTDAPSSPSASKSVRLPGLAAAVATAHSLQPNPPEQHNHQSAAGAPETPRTAISRSRFQNAVDVLLKFFSIRAAPSDSAIKQLTKYRFFGLDPADCEVEVASAAKTFISSLAELVEQFEGPNESGLSTEGLYRINGEVTKVQKYRILIGNNCLQPEVYMGELKKEDNIHNLTGLLKNFLRELKMALISNELLFKFSTIDESTAGKHSDKYFKKLHKDIYLVLPLLNREILHLVFLHLRKVVDEKGNAMDQSNVARVFGPTLCCVSPISDAQSPENMAKVHKSSVYANNIIDSMLDTRFLKLL